ncbi:hypothetical protein [Rhizobium paknamense]|uniref:Oxidoreductase molybdopterin-binding domain-containing protein n=1 Tax=Rhizobium paknamense TaxID=1206817 RepID=A0ABU0ICZ1_9HYPH|nr:hypothetical protein [Rhizobium paknamense]MDQ0455483.1 hypothetical protein [Rhizobium paknamense]
MMRFKTISMLLIAGAVFMEARIAQAGEIVPNGCVSHAFLNVSGNIATIKDKDTNSYQFSEQDFMALPAHDITTATLWTEKSRFTGPLLKDALDKAGATGDKLRLVALDNFAVEASRAFLEKYGAILAHSKDNERLKISDFGPIFVMLPRDQYREDIDTPLGTSYMVWQLCGIEVE